jgi:hypothetical protein
MPLRFGSAVDLGGGRAAVEWIVRGPLREPSFSVRLDGSLDVVSAMAFHEPKMMPPPPPSLTAEQPVIDRNSRGGTRVSLALPSITGRDADPVYFEDNVVVRVELQDPSGEAPAGNVDNGASLTWVARDGSVESTRLRPVKVR